MRVLIYGFGPYRQFRDNITAKIIQQLPKSDDLRKIVFPVRFNRKQFVQTLKRNRPDAVRGRGHQIDQRGFPRMDRRIAARLSRSRPDGKPENRQTREIMFATTRCTSCLIISRTSILRFFLLSSTFHTTTIGERRAASCSEFYGSVVSDSAEAELKINGCS